jgi:hypothetical protein
MTKLCLVFLLAAVIMQGAAIFTLPEQTFTLTNGNTVTIGPAVGEVLTRVNIPWAGVAYSRPHFITSLDGYFIRPIEFGRNSLVLPVFTTIPEPSTLGLYGIGASLIALSRYARKRRRGSFGRGGR